MRISILLLLALSSCGIYDSGVAPGLGADGDMALSLNRYHSCSLKNFQLRCWGSNGNGQIGTGTLTNIGDDEYPNSIAAVDVGDDVKAIGTGNFYTCALTTAGQVKCWGYHEYGALGYPGVMQTPQLETPASLAYVNTGVTATHLAVGTNNVCIIHSGGKVRCWGANSSNTLGNSGPAIGDDEHPATGQDVDLGGDAVQVSIGTSFVCALLTTGNVRCWGWGLQGSLGYGNTNTIGDNETPASAGDVSLGGKVKKIVSGGTHSCALLENGTVRCWGNSSNGALGYGNNTAIGNDEVPSSLPVVDLGGATVVDISAGRDSTCVLFEDGETKCWGASGSGELGQGNMTTVSDPTTISNIQLAGNVASIATGYNSTCAILTDDNIQCWGANGSGQLGISSTTNIGDNEVPGTGPLSRVW